MSGGGLAGERTRVRTGRYTIFANGIECGEERWSLEASDEGLVVTGNQELQAPHPFPSRLEYRVTLTGWRVTGIELHWTVGMRSIRAVHHAEAERWRAHIESGAEARTQEGDYPAVCEVEIPSHVSAMFVLAHRAFQIDGEHEFPVLRIGPPVMAVSPERMIGVVATSIRRRQSPGCEGVDDRAVGHDRQSRANSLPRGGRSGPVRSARRPRRTGT